MLNLPTSFNDNFMGDILGKSSGGIKREIVEMSYIQCRSTIERMNRLLKN